MACVRREEKIEGITERVFGMKNKKEKIDLLLEKNAGQQLAKVDWDGLDAAISSRLDKASQGKTHAIKFPSVSKIAAGIAAAAVVFIVLMVGIEKAPDLQLDNGSRAVVKFIDKKGAASVEIKRASAKSEVFIGIGGSQRKLAKCDVKMIDMNGDLRKGGSGAAWIIISRPEPLYADNGAAKDMRDLICMF